MTITKQELQKLYNEMPAVELAKKLGISRGLLYRKMLKAGIKMNKKIIQTKFIIDEKQIIKAKTS